MEPRKGTVEMRIEMTRDWEDLGVPFIAGEIYHLSESRQILESDFWYFGLYHIAKDHTKVIEKPDRGGGECRS